jgi:hypothetical protein
MTILRSVMVIDNNLLGRGDIEGDVQLDISSLLANVTLRARPHAKASARAGGGSQCKLWSAVTILTEIHWFMHAAGNVRS